MGFLKKLFGQKSAAQEAEEQEARMAQLFDNEWRAAKVRFYRTVGLGPRIEFKDSRTDALVPAHVALADNYAEWKETPVLYLRRRMMFTIIQELDGVENVWQAANYIVSQCRADDALETLEEEAPPVAGTEDYAAHCAAYAWTYIVLIREREAIEWARRAVAAAPENHRYQTFLADALHLSGEHEEAHTIYSHLMAQAPKAQADREEAVSEMFVNLFRAETGVMSSPVMAAQFAQGMADPEQSEEFWSMGEHEFYDSPYFRLMHSYHLLRQGEHQRYLAKLATLVQEMPWVKEANINLIGFLEQVDPTGTEIFPELQSEVRERIRANKWTVEDMRQFEVEM